MRRGTYDAHWAGTAIAITDNDGGTYIAVTDDWPRSNPKGYGEWFKTRMAVVLERRKRVLAERTNASVEDIPDYKVRTPLQDAVMILKRHRDHMFENRKDQRPISVIITTLAAHAYEGEEMIGEALVAILTGMERHILWDNNRYSIRTRATRWKTSPTSGRSIRSERRPFRMAAEGEDGIRRGSTFER